MHNDDNAWPQKTRDLHNHHLDTTIWDDFEFKEGDVIIASWPKSGSTWAQQLVGQLLYNGVELDVAHISPWIDLRVPPVEAKLGMLSQQSGRRFYKAHVPVDALVYSQKAKYVYVGRDGRDVVWSLFNHHSRANDTWYGMLNNTPGLVGPPMPKPAATAHEYFLNWLEKDGDPLWSFWDQVKSWWSIRELPNIYFTHFQRLKENFDEEARKIAEFLEVPVDTLNWEAITENCSFSHMKENAAAVAPLGGGLWEGGAKTFIHKGTNGRWKDTLSAEDVARYEATAREKLGEDCARWLETGELP